MNPPRQSDGLRLRAYGRHLQSLVAQLCAEPDRAQRNAAAHALIAQMSRMSQNAQRPPTDEAQLWNHLAYLSHYQLDIDYPCAIHPLQPSPRPRPVPYPVGAPRLRHYGRITEQALRHVALEPHPERRAQQLRLVVEQMRRQLTALRSDGVDMRRLAAEAELLTEGAITAAEVLALEDL